MFQYSNKPNECEWTEIQRGQLLNIWEMKKGTNSVPQTSYFYDFSSHCLALINNGQNRPELVWGLYPFGAGNTNYTIWKCYDNTDFYEYQSASGSQTSYTDLSEIITTGNSHIVYYALSDEDQINFSNIVGSGYIPHPTQGGSDKIIGKYNFIRKQKSFNLSQNYPNPFNPNSTITFTIPNPEYTQLKVYDIFGREIKTLIKESLTAGTHSVEFNAKNLASGVYFLL